MSSVESGQDGSEPIRDDQRPDGIPDRYWIPWQVFRNARIKPAGKLVLACLRDRQGRRAHCWPSIRTIAEDCGLRTDTVMAAIRQLESCKLVSVDRTVKQHPHYTVTYSVTVVPESGTAKLLRNPGRDCYGKRNQTVTESGTEPSSITKLNNQESAHTAGDIKDLKKKKADGGLTVDVAVSVFEEVYRQVKNADPDRIGERGRGRLRKFLDENRPDLSTWSDRLRCAAGLNGDQPWPFRDTGELTIEAVIVHWGRIGEATRAGSSRFRPDGTLRSPPGKYAHVKGTVGYVGVRAN